MKDYRILPIENPVFICLQDSDNHEACLLIYRSSLIIDSSSLIFDRWRNCFVIAAQKHE